MKRENQQSGGEVITLDGIILCRKWDKNELTNDDS